MSMDTFSTADLLDDFPEADVLPIELASFGGKESFCGKAVTVTAPEDNSLVRETLETDGNNRILIVDGGGSRNCALLGDRLAQLAIDNNWAGVIIYGCIRDSAVITSMEIGVKALATNPRKSHKRGLGQVGGTIDISGTLIDNNSWLYADSDGVLVSNRDLLSQNT